ncbi:hypothetical protein G4D82_13135 [Flavobacterium sp. CYK-4]|uniref:hypothetical protein n=1 Tax=Flavobacterium lotistagni TaxID=2709660 RepID=UPI00140AEC23|nr:hypothetical protein [Flavobacterium lotistagni]NHM08170.1 hypothetical protein [Flavobacterium lotistagni]
MKNLQNIGVGFLVSFLGSIPLGYLNVIGFALYQYAGIGSLIPFLLGVMTIESVVIYGSLVFANRLVQRQQWLKWIEAFSVVFILAMAAVFYLSSKQPQSQEQLLEKYLIYSPYFIGLILSSFNFIQLPFWAGWNLYVLNGKYIDIEQGSRFSYLLGTLLGTFSGMLVLILSLAKLSSQTEFLSQNMMHYLIPAAFVLLGIYQGFQFGKKYFKAK